MNIISVWSQKGGVGKTILSINIAAGLVAQGYKVAVVDLDPQGNCGSSSTVAAMDTKKLLKFPVSKEYNLATQADYIVLDHPSGTVYVPGNQKVGAVNLVITPFQPCVLDYHAWKASIRMLNGLKMLPVINRVNKIRREDQQVIDLMMSQSVKTKKPLGIINDRSIFKRQIGEGQSVYTAGTRYGAREAIAEIDKLIAYIINM